MPLPDFTPIEEYIVKAIKVESPGRGASATAGYLVACIVMAAIAVYQSNHLLMNLAFLVLCVFRIYEAYAQWKWHPYFRSVIEKYEAAIQSQSINADNEAGDAVAL